MGLVPSSNYQIASAELEEYSKIFKGETQANTLVLYAEEPTTQNISVQLQVNRSII